MRVKPDELAFSYWLLSLGNGLLQSPDLDYMPDAVEIP